MADNVVEFTILGIDRFSRTMSGVSGSIGTLTKRFAILAGGISGAVGGLTAFTLRVAKSQNEAGKFANRIGVAVDELTRYQHAADLSELSTQQFNLAVQRMTRRSQEAAKGTGEAVRAFADLGINAKEFSALPLEQKLLTLADRMQNFGGDKLATAFKLFDSEGTAMLQMLNQGSGAMQQMAADADRLGLVVSDRAAKSASDLRDAWTRLLGANTGVLRALTEEIGPFIETMLNRMTDFLVSIREGLAEFTSGFVKGIFTAFEVAKQFFVQVQKWVNEMSTWPGFVDLASRFVKSFGQAFTWIVNNALTTARLFAEIFFNAVDIISKAIFEGIKWAWQKVFDFITGKDLAGSFESFLKHIIPEALKTEIESAKMIFADFGDHIEDTATTAGKAISGALGINLDEAGRKAEEVIEKITSAAEIAAAKIEETSTRVRTFLEELHVLAQSRMDALGTWQKQLAETVLGSIEAGVSNVSSAIAAGLTGMQNLGEALKAALQSAIAQLIGALIQAGLQRLVLNKIIQASALSESIQAAASGLSQVYLNSFSSAAAIPIYGWQIAPGVAAGNVAIAQAGMTAAAAAGAAIGASTASAGLPAAHGGLDYVPAESTYLLDRGERVLSPRQNLDLTDFLSTQQRGGGSVGNMNVTINAGATDLSRMSETQIRERIARPVLKALDEMIRRGESPRFLARGSS